MERNMINPASGDTLMDKTHVAAQVLISIMTKNSQQFNRSWMSVR